MQLNFCQIGIHFAQVTTTDVVYRLGTQFDKLCA
jgi:hypothetical protein